MRDFIVMMGFIGLLPLCFMRPAVGILVWTWFAIMNPHREAFGFAQQFNFNLYIAAITLAGWVLSRESKMIPITWSVFLYTMWVIWTFLSTYKGAFVPERSVEFMYFIPFKVFIFSYMLLILINNEQRLIALIWMLCVSIGYYGTQIGLVGLLTGGQNLGKSGNFGPYGTMIQDRNHLSLAIIMILPLLLFLAKHTADARIQKILYAVLVFSILAVFVSFSRGAMIALVVSSGYLWLFSKYKLKSSVAILLLAIPALLFMPPEWWERMNISEHIATDKSFQDRVAAWKMAISIADASPWLGGGFRVTEEMKVVEQFGFQHGLMTPLAAHSIYFQVLAEHGYAGLFIFLSMLASGLLSSIWVYRKTKSIEELLWARHLSLALQTSYIAFISGGAALSLAYYDGFYVLLVASIILKILVKKQLPNFKPAYSKTPKKVQFNTEKKSTLKNAQTVI